MNEQERFFIDLIADMKLGDEEGYKDDAAETLTALIVEARQLRKAWQFNPMTDVPKNDAEAVVALAYGKDEMTKIALTGIYRCRRAIGEDVLTAYKTALHAAVEAFDKAAAREGR